MRRSILALPITLALVVAAPGLAWAGHKFRHPAGATREIAGKTYPVYEMSGTLPIEGHGAVTSAIKRRCLDPTPSTPPQLRFLYVDGPRIFQSNIVRAGADGSFVTTVGLPVSEDSVTYRVRLRCADNLSATQPATNTANLVRVGTSYTVFEVDVPLAPTGSHGDMLALAGVALLVTGCLLVLYERHLGRAG